MNNPLVEYIKTNFPKVSQAALTIIDSSFIQQEKGKGTLLVAQGDICRNLYFLTKGISRSYSLKDGQDITTWFGFKHDFITSFTSFFPKAPSYESIEMLSDGTVYQISYHELVKIRTASVEIERIINHFSFLYTVQLEQRLFDIQTLTAAEKYKRILEQEPHLIQSISNKYLASYLGITRETLSRIRSKH